VSYRALVCILLWMAIRSSSTPRRLRSHSEHSYSAIVRLTTEDFELKQQKESTVEWSLPPFVVPSIQEKEEVDVGRSQQVGVSVHILDKTSETEERSFGNHLVDGDEVVRIFAADIDSSRLEHSEKIYLVQGLQAAIAQAKKVPDTASDR
jgi:hypothetical protein